MEQVNLLEHNGYEVNQMWECEWNKIKNNLDNKSEIEKMLDNKILILEMHYLVVELKVLNLIINVIKIKRYFILILFLYILL